MKKFLLSLLLVIGGVLFFNVSDVYAITELEAEKIKDAAGLTEDNRVESPEEMSNYYGTKCWCEVKEFSHSNMDLKRLYVNVGSGYQASDNFKGLNSTRYGGNPNVDENIQVFDIDGVPEFTDNWLWNTDDLTKFLINKEGINYTTSGFNTSDFNGFDNNDAYFSGYYVYIRSTGKDGVYGDFKITYNPSSGSPIEGFCKYSVMSDYKGAKFDEESQTFFNQHNMGIVTMKQQDMKGSSPYWRINSCNQCAFDLLIQNSGLIKDSKYQCTGLVFESGTKWKAYCDALKSAGACGKDISGGGVFVGATTKELDFFKDITGNTTWSHISANTSLDGNDIELVETSIVRWGNKDIKDMTKQEVATMLKVFYNNDYFCILGIKDKDSEGNDAKANGPTGYKGAHVVLFAGCKANEVFFNDSSHGRITSYTNDTTLYPDDSTPVRWMTAIKVNGASTKKICGGGSATITQKDKEVVESLGIPSSILEQKYENDELISSYCKLMETDLESILADVNRDNLTGDQLDSLNTWEDTIADSSKSGGVLYWIRVVTMWIGILLVVWAVLLYVGFWFDRANNFIDISVVTILTLGMLATSETDEEYTYGNKDSKGIKTINNKILLKICICSIIVGVLIISGLLYTIIAKLVFLVKGLISKGA